MIYQVVSFHRLCDNLFNLARSVAPYDKGNLSQDATRMVFEDENTCRIYVDERIAPYMKYTNEPWVSSWWKGKQNPNLYWFDMAATVAMMYISRSLAADAQKVRTEFVDVDEMARKYQNKRGDYFPEDVLLHSSYIENAGDPYATFDSRFALL